MFDVFIGYTYASLVFAQFSAAIKKSTKDHYNGTTDVCKTFVL